MKTFFSLLIFSLFLFNYTYASQSTVNVVIQKQGVEKNISKGLIDQLVTIVKAKINYYKEQFKAIKDFVLSSDLKIPLVLMCVGLIFLIFAQALHDKTGVVWAVGAIFFLIGALLLLFDLLGVSL